MTRLRLDHRERYPAISPPGPIDLDEQ